MRFLELSYVSVVWYVQMQLAKVKELDAGSWFAAGQFAGVGSSQALSPRELQFAACARTAQHIKLLILFFSR